MLDTNSLPKHDAILGVELKDDGKTLKDTLVQMKSLVYDLEQLYLDATENNPRFEGGEGTWEVDSPISEFVFTVADDLDGQQRDQALRYGYEIVLKFVRKHWRE